MAFPDVKKGQPFVPNLFVENGIRHILNESQVVSGGKIKGYRVPTKVGVYNVNSAPIEPGHIVNFDAGSFTDDAIPCVPLKDENKPYGIATNGISGKGFGSVVVAGPVKVKISGSGGDYAVPDTSKLGWFKSSSTGVPVLFRNGEDAVINLGGGGVSGSVSKYAGQFKIKKLSNTQVEIVFGETDLNYCGETDVPGCTKISRATVNVHEKDKTNVFLCFFHSGSTYSYRFETNVPDDAVFFAHIGYVSGGSIHQLLEISASSQLNFGNDWYL